MRGMLRHWKTEGQIPIAAVQNLTQQMWEAVAFMHANSFVHRDVKGDNFFMDLPEVGSTANRIYLGDFGTAVKLPPGARLSKKQGTWRYWSPEVYRHNYAQKA